jgi:hypothetical protein
MDDMIDGSVVFPWQRIGMRALIEDCCGWNRKTWADAVEFALGALPYDLSGKLVIEVGASEKSSLAPIFAARNAHVVCSYYNKPPGFIERPLHRLCVKYKLHDIPTIDANVMALPGRYDVIVMKSVLGGVFRNNDYEGLSALMRRLVLNNLNPQGTILSFDNGYINAFHKLRHKHHSGGGVSWTYLKRDKLERALNGFDFVIAGFGYLNVGQNALLNSLVYQLDKLVVGLVKPTERAVLASVIRNSGE